MTWFCYGSNRFRKCRSRTRTKTVHIGTELGQNQDGTKMESQQNQKSWHTTKFTWLQLIAGTKDKLQVREIVKRKSVRQLKKLK